MVPQTDEEIIIVAAFRREDLIRMHTLLACYESPHTSGEAADREIDEQAHEALRRYVAVLLH
jgi:uncharacterized protein YcbK (DUF882 family)